MLIVILVLAGVAFDPLHPVPSVPVALVLALQVLHCLTPWRNRWTLLAQVVLLPWAGPAAAGLVAASVLLLLRGLPRWALFGAVVAGAALMVPAEPFAVALALLNALCQGLVLFGVTRLGHTRAAVHAARAELAAAAVSDERARAARDLDDALGTALSRITALATRGELAEIARVSRRAAALARSVPDRPAPPGPPDDLLPRLALPILLTVHGGFLLTALIYLDGRPAPALLAAAILALQLHHALPRPPDTLPPGIVWTMPALVALTAAALLFPGQAYPQLAGFAAAAFLLLDRAWRLGAPVLIACLIAALALRGYPAGEIVYWTFNSVAVAVMLHALAVQTRLVYEAREARITLAHIAATRERRRISRDVHDLLGQGLSTITIRAELAQRLPTTDGAPTAVGSAADEAGAPARAGADGQVAQEIAAIARRSLTALRAIALDEELDLSLDAEVVSARSVLEAAGAEVTVRRQSPREERLLAIVLREAVTNVLRHSTATHCLIDIDDTGLRIVNDGVSGTVRGSGRGTANLTERVVAAGGTLTAGAHGGRYELAVLYPAVVDSDTDGVQPVARV
ncbi:sensor histidine kinase [Kitasatospora sp. NPDC054939]